LEASGDSNHSNARARNPEERRIPNGAEFRIARNPGGRNCWRRQGCGAPCPAPSLRPPTLRAVPRSWSFRFLEFGALRDSRSSECGAVRDFAPFCWRLSTKRRT